MGHVIGETPHSNSKPFQHGLLGVDETPMAMQQSLLSCWNYLHMFFWDSQSMQMHMYTCTLTCKCELYNFQYTIWSHVVHVSDWIIKRNIPTYLSALACNIIYYYTSLRWTQTNINCDAQNLNRIWNRENYWDWREHVKCSQHNSRYIISMNWLLD